MSNEFHRATALGDRRPAHARSRNALDTVSGPIAPIDCFGYEQRSILSQYAREGLIASAVLDGCTYVGYYDVYSRPLSDHFESDLDHPAAWDGTYAETWSSWRRVKGRWVKPRGFDHAVRSDLFPRISLSRQTGYVESDSGERRSVRAAYPQRFSDGAAGLFQALYRQNGFMERFRQWQPADVDQDIIEPLTAFGDHEVEWFRKFAAEDGLRIRRFDGDEVVLRSDLIYYDLFASKVIEDALDLERDGGLERPDNVEVMLDGTFSYGSPFRVPTLLRCKQDVVTTG